MWKGLSLFFQRLLSSPAQGFVKIKINSKSLPKQVFLVSLKTIKGDGGSHLACWSRVCCSERSVGLFCAELTGLSGSETSGYKPAPCGCAGRRVHSSARPGLVTQNQPASQQAGACCVVGSHRWALVHPEALVAAPAAKANTPVPSTNLAKRLFKVCKSLKALIPQHACWV